MVPDDERRSHVDQTRPHAVQHAVREEHPLEVRHEGRPDAAHAEDARPDEAPDAVAAVTEAADEADGDRGAGEGYAEGQRPDPVCSEATKARLNSKKLFTRC